MKTTIIYILSILFMMSCTSNEEKVEEKQAEEIVEKDQDYWTVNNCLRGIPTSTLYSKELKYYNFDLKEDKGVETAVWQNGDSLIVENRGCEVFWLTYTYYVKGTKMQENNLDLLRYCFNEVEQIDLAPIDLKGGMDLIDKWKANNEKLNLGVEHFLKEDNVSEMFEIDEIDLKQDASKVVFSFAIGNL